MRSFIPIAKESKFSWSESVLEDIEAVSESDPSLEDTLAEDDELVTGCCGAGTWLITGAAAPALTLPSSTKSIISSDADPEAGSALLALAGGTVAAVSGIIFALVPASNDPTVDLDVSELRRAIA